MKYLGNYMVDIKDFNYFYIYQFPIKVSKKLCANPVRIMHEVN